MRADRGQDWVSRIADDVLAGRPEDPAAPVVCASGISPSGPVHLGNLRELMVPHLVGEEIRARGLRCEHILSWDDHDRLRRVPAGAPAGIEEFVGRSLSAVPDPCGEHPSWAEHFKAPLREALTALGIAVREISQAERYDSGAYAEQIVRAMDRRAESAAVLATHRTAKPANAAEGEHYPYRVYCETCGRDATTVTGYRSGPAEVAYGCDACGATGAVRLRERNSGKLVWKIDWPMRWAYEGVAFEAGGVDHSSPGSSYTVGSAIVRSVFDGRPPHYVGYSFVGSRGTAKLSGSYGAVPTPRDALRVIEAPILRWLYARRRPEQAITVDLGPEVGRLYDEWDALRRRVSAGTAGAGEVATYRRAAAPDGSPLPVPARPLPFRVLASIVDVAAGDEGQIARVLAHLDHSATSPADTEPRLSRAANWVDQLDAGDRCRPRSAPDRDLLAGLDDPQRQALRLFLDRLDRDWSLDGLTALVYGVPKVQRGLPPDTAPTAELKAAQREFFVLLYRLLVAADTGPRLPTLLLALGAGRVRELVSPLVETAPN